MAVERIDPKEEPLKIIPELRERLVGHQVFANRIQALTLKLVGEMMVFHEPFHPEDVVTQLNHVLSTVRKAGVTGKIPLNDSSLALSPQAEEMLDFSRNKDGDPEPGRWCNRRTNMENKGRVVLALDERGNHTLRALARLVAVHLHGQDKFASWVEVVAGLEEVMRVVKSW